MSHGVGDRHKTIPLALFYNALGVQVRNAASLPGFHTLSGPDVTCRFAGKAILKFWQALCELGQQDDIVCALSQLGVAETPSEDTTSSIEAFICKVYLLTRILQA